MLPRLTHSTPSEQVTFLFLRPLKCIKVVARLACGAGRLLNSGQQSLLLPTLCQRSVKLALERVFPHIDHGWVIRHWAHVEAGPAQLPAGFGSSSSSRQAPCREQLVGLPCSQGVLCVPLPGVAGAVAGQGGTPPCRGQRGVHQVPALLPGPRALFSGRHGLFPEAEFLTGAELRGSSVRSPMNASLHPCWEKLRVQRSEY